MRNMKSFLKIYSTSFVLLFVTVILCGCSSSSAKSENAIKEDISNYDNLLISSMDDRTFTFEKRQTDKKDKIDKVWVSVDAKDEIANYQASYEVKYVLYNDGWIFESIDITDRKLFPVEGTDRYVGKWSDYDERLYTIYEVNWDNSSILLESQNSFIVTSLGEYDLTPYFFDGSDGGIIDFGFQYNESLNLSLHQDSGHFRVPYQVNDDGIRYFFNLNE